MRLIDACRGREGHPSRPRRVCKHFDPIADTPGETPGVSAAHQQDGRMSLPQLRRVRWAVRATLSLGVAASVAANILHAEPNPISQVIAAWPPLALLLTVELISRVPVHRRSLAAVRLGATTAIAGIAAWVSYWHMAGVAARYGETGASPYLLPLSVDGLVIVASVSLVELAGRIRLMEEALAAETAARTAEAAHTAQAARAAEAARTAQAAGQENGHRPPAPPGRGDGGARGAHPGRPAGPDPGRRRRPARHHHAAAAPDQASGAGAGGRPCRAGAGQLAPPHLHDHEGFRHHSTPDPS